MVKAEYWTFYGADAEYYVDMVGFVGKYKRNKYFVECPNFQVPDLLEYWNACFPDWDSGSINGILDKLKNHYCKYPPEMLCIPYDIERFADMWAAKRLKEYVGWFSMQHGIWCKDTTKRIPTYLRQWSIKRRQAIDREMDDITGGW